MRVAAACERRAFDRTEPRTSIIIITFLRRVRSCAYLFRAFLGVRFLRNVTHLYAFEYLYMHTCERAAVVGGGVSS